MTTQQSQPGTAVPSTNSPPTRLALIGLSRGLTPAQLAARISWPLPTVQAAWAGGEGAANLNLGVYQALADALDLPVHVLLREPCPRCLGTERTVWGRCLGCGD